MDLLKDAADNVPDLFAAVRRIQLEHLSRDRATGQVFAVGFNRNGEPFRAYEMDPKFHQDPPEGFTYAA
jgi:hypothetical protein